MRVFASSNLSKIIVALILPLIGCSGPSENNRSTNSDSSESNKGILSKRLIVLKAVNTYGDYEDKDADLVTRLCIEKYNGSITQEAFEARYGNLNARLVSGPAIEYTAQTQIDERRKVTEECIEYVLVPTYLDGVAMNDGKRVAVRKQREIVEGRIRNIYVQCTAFEYHF